MCRNGSYITLPVFMLKYSMCVHVRERERKEARECEGERGGGEDGGTLKNHLSL